MRLCWHDFSNRHFSSRSTNVPGNDWMKEKLSLVGQKTLPLRVNGERWGTYARLLRCDDKSAFCRVYGASRCTGMKGATNGLCWKYGQTGSRDTMNRVPTKALVESTMTVNVQPFTGGLARMLMVESVRIVDLIGIKIICIHSIIQIFAKIYYFFWIKEISFIHLANIGTLKKEKYRLITSAIFFLLKDYPRDGIKIK